MGIFQQLGDLFLQAIPTVVIVFLFYLFMRWAFFGPIQKAMGERSARIEGARKDAAEVEAAAKKELDDYNEALKKARGEIYAEQEQARQAVLDERAKLLKAIRSRSQEEVDAAKKKVAVEFAASRAQLEPGSSLLGKEIAEKILAGPSSPRGGARP
jgi:F0F1-type ATP synthase membrane subunit b/b'